MVNGGGMMVQCIAGLGTFLLTVMTAGCAASAGPVTPGPGDPPAGLSVRLREVAHGLDAPLFLTSPPGDLTRAFVVEQGGRIRIIKNDALALTPFLDISGRVSSGGERGLLGLAFHPQYASNGRFVVYYTNPSGDIRIASFKVTSDPDVADPASEQTLLAVPHPGFSNHNGGMVVFGPDGRLYAGLGDGGGGGDPNSNGQNRNVLLGKLVRLDVNAAGQASVPADNPFVGQQGMRPEIWSYGLRNPWRFSFDRQGGQLYIGDVGQNAREEIDVTTNGRGLNFGWNITEGFACYSPSSGCNKAGITQPVLDYGHDDGCSVTGGYVYRGAAVPGLRGFYFYADYCNGWVRSFLLSGGAATQPIDWASLRPGGQITSFGEDAEGEVYIVSSGSVFRIEAAP
jgi:glucose/arabinose dehydrogenase